MLEACRQAARTAAYSAVAAAGRAARLPAATQGIGRMPSMLSLARPGQGVVIGLSRCAARMALALLLIAGAAPAPAQDSAAQDAARRRAVLADLPADAAKRVFGLQTTPAPGPAQAIGGY